MLAMDGASGSATLLKKLFCDADIMVIAKAVPIEPDTCIKVFTKAVPSGYRFLGSWFKPLVCAGIMTNDRPIMRPECNKITIRADVAVVTLDRFHSITSIMIKSGVISNFGPWVSNTRPTNGDRIPLSAPPDISTSPAASAVNPRPVCRYKGRRIIVDRIIINVAATLNTPKVNIGYLKARKPSIGLSSFSCLSENIASDVKAIIIELMTSKSPQPLSPARLKP